NHQVETSEIIGRPGVVSGAVSVHARSVLLGGELNFRNKWWDNGNNRIDLIAGYRFLSLQEKLIVEEQTIGLAGAGAAAGISAGLTDKFETTNLFNGAQVGAIFDHVAGRWTFSLTGKIAAGVTRERS